ncbi:radical SAM protein [candidate division KSB1 bacterium]|nr:radical SAM protein [candidate division KSB1 bacterium]
MSFEISPVSSGGIHLTYQCPNRCAHCIYASSPSRNEWMTEENLILILEQIKQHSQFLTGMHIGGGEPFLNLDLLEFTIRKMDEIEVPLDYVETNGFWAWEDQKTRRILKRMQNAGLRGLLVSASPFHLEFIPMDRVNRAIRIGREVFGPDRVFIYTNNYYDQFQTLDPKITVPFDEYLDELGEEHVVSEMVYSYSLIPGGRAAIRLARLFTHQPASHYFGETCAKELSSPHHIRIDPEANYIAGLCAGLSLGDARQLHTIYNGLDLTPYPILENLAQGGVEALYNWAAQEYGYIENPLGYIAKCHLCLDIRRYLVDKKTQFMELAPIGFYSELD